MNTLKVIEPLTEAVKSCSFIFSVKKVYFQNEFVFTDTVKGEIRKSILKKLPFLLLASTLYRFGALWIGGL